MLDESLSQNTNNCASSTQRWSREKNCSSRPNNWGGPTYTELITNAILSAPQQRLTLSQIYNCLVQQVEYFRERKNYNSSQGWKVGKIEVHGDFKNSKSDALSGLPNTKC